MNLLYAYKEIEKRLDTIDFSALFDGFRRYDFALYNDENCCLNGRIIQKTDAFLGNTSILYAGKHTAIWMLSEDETDWDVLASKIIHEMFHAYQNEAGEKNHANELEALMHYRYDALNLSAKMKEAELMRKCLSENDPEAYARLISLRSARKARFSYEYAYEARVEQIEGAAVWVEFAALDRLDARKGKAARERAFAETADAAQYFPVRAVTYTTGAMLFECVSRFQKEKIKAFPDIPLALEVLCDVPEGEMPALDERVLTQAEAYFAQTETIVRSALDKGSIVLQGNYPLLGLNVYNARWNGRYAVSYGFVAYAEDKEACASENPWEKARILQGDFVIEMSTDLRIKTVFSHESTDG